jgi:hypothetical protein
MIAIFCMPAAAQESEFPAPTLSVILWSARSCYAEATWSQADCTALLHVIRKRALTAGWSFIRMLKAYSVKNWVQSEHGQQALALELGTNKGQSASWNSSWQKLVMHVVDVLRGRTSDPCPTANHWAAKYYQPKSPMRRVACEVETANAFWVASG